MALPGSVCQLLLVVSLCLLCVTHAGKEELEGERPISRLAYLLSKRSAGLLAPPMAHAARLAPYLRSMSKRDDGYWIWMPANGYMPVPRDEGATFHGARDSTSLMRYG